MNNFKSGDVCFKQQKFCTTKVQAPVVQRENKASYLPEKSLSEEKQHSFTSGSSSSSKLYFNSD